ncbi:serine/threonine protein kinase and signal transduction histidine kinase with GAF and PAS/PAC sensor [Calothrix sp. NIES-2100]|uniref:PAS domain-containing protein n=1 Tax=Calothrix sp. NIES-2100 TaxID=1954172 RepID=UPI000B6141EF|nr:serine/threonine protein kinase and signal transduction histidine kinase with GAF and PAS/PAC sensor [Calothrix sp. NIES-2100]
MIALPGIAIQNKIYESSNSLVYRGIREDGVAIIVKMLKLDYPSPQELTRYRQEYKITRSLNLEGVVRAYSQQDYQRTLVILLEDFGGKSLEQWMHKRPDIFCPMPLSQFLSLAIALTDILGRIHAANVIHKDINPGNIVLNLDTGVVKIIDFGIATQFNRTNPTFKSPHVLEGTLAYLSPEQTGRMNRLLDYRTDFYSLGVTFYQMLTGYLPFPTTDILELVHCHIAKYPIPPDEINTTIPKPFSDIILKLMAKNAENRYQSAWGIKADLEICAEQLAQIGQISSFQLGFQDVCDRFQIPQKLYGREKEVAMLLAAFDRVACPESNPVAALPNNSETTSQSEQRGKPKFQVEMMLVSGYAGVGKSALVQEIYKPITQKHGYFISGKFDQFQRNIPYSAIASALQKLVQQLLSEPDYQVQQWRSLLLTALGSNGQIIIDIIPEVELIIGKQSPVPEIGATEAQNRFHRIFGQFVRVFCSKKHPLAIFLDDLQWIDSATLNLIELMLLDEQAQSLFLIGAYRDNEVKPTHPLALMLERLRKQGVVLQEIILAPLTLLPLNQLITETLHRNADIVRLLAELVLRKTEGNPFFVNEFLRMLYSENLLTFDAEHLCWQWNIADIQAQDITDNVVELLLIQLNKLPENTQQILQLAACIGAEFNLDTLSIVCDKPPETVFQDLLAAIQVGLIQPLSELDENLLIQEYKFLHDRVQQAAYALTDESNKQIVHLQIGRNLLKEVLAVRLSDRLFEIVDHLNHGIELITNQTERDEIAKLNLIAGQKAKVTIAYSTARNYLAIGRQWLEAATWETNYELTLALYVETTEVAFLCGNFEDVERWAAIVLQHVKTVLDRITVYRVKIQADIAQNQPLQAVNTGLQILQQLGIIFLKQPSHPDVCIELDIITSFLDEKTIEDLIHLPNMVEPEKLAAMQILSDITTAAKFAAPNLLLPITSKQVNLSILYGNASVSPFSYAIFGLILCGLVGDIESGYQFGQLALGLLSQPNTHSLKARTLFMAHEHVLHWKEHIKESLEPLLEAYQIGLETGDLEFAAYCAHCYCFHLYVVGKELVEVEYAMTTYNEAISRIKQKTALTWNQTFQQAIANLMGYSVNPIHLIGQFYNEKDGLPKHEVANDGTAIFDAYFNKLYLCYLFSEYAQAIENSDLAEPYFIPIIGTPLAPLYYFYDALARLAIYPESSTEVQAEIFKKVTAKQEEMKRWAYYAPMNYLHKYHLVEAEKARVLSQLLEAEEFYEQAIQGAKQNEYIQEEALAYELAAKFYLARGRGKFAQTYMKEAHYCYERWGARAKVKDLETRYPQLFPQSSSIAHTPIRTTSGTSSNHLPIAFDLAAVMKASLAISSEIELDKLLSSLMKILIENAGAQTGFLILENSGKWAIEASCELNDDEKVYATQVLQSLPIANRLPESIINYVIRTHESVILNDATSESHFINEPYIQQNQTKSLLCLPLLNQSKLVGVLYLENQLATGVFTLDRVPFKDATRSQVLNLLSTQAAIAIENARLYSKLRDGKSQINQFLEAVQVGIGVLDATGRPYYINQRGIQLLGKGVDPTATPDHLAEVYQVYLAGTDRECSPEDMPIVRALKGERTRTDDLEIHQGETIIPIEAWGTPVFDEQGKVAYAIVAFQDITERKQTEHLLANYNRTLEQQVAQRTAALEQSEAELRHREQELRLIANALPVLISYVDANRCYQFINHTYEVWFNRSRDQILGNPVRQLLGEAVYQRVEPYINQVFAGQTVSLETEIPFPDDKRCISATLIPDFDDNAQVRGFYSIMTDISERKQAEEVLRQSEAQFREQAILSDFRADVDSALAQSASLPLMLHRCAQAVVKHFNAAFARIWTLNKDKNILELQASAGMYTRLDGEYSLIPVGSVKVGQIAQERRPLLINNVFDESSINQEWAKREGMVAFAGYPILLDEQLVGVIAMFTRHPIPSSNFEALEFSAREIALGIRRKQAEEALQASEAELRALFCAMPDPLLVVNAQGRILRATLLESEKLSNPIDEQVGRTFSEIFERSQADTFLSCIRQALSTQQPLTIEYSSIVGGWKTWFATRISPISEHSVIWLARDITDRKRAEEASILEERNHMAREIHDTLAQAFTGIIIHARSASNKVTADPEKAQTLLTQILDLARSGLAEARRSVEALHRPYLLESSNLQDALSRLAAQLDSSIATQIVYEVMGTPYPLSSDLENNLFRIGQEALTNAIKHAVASEIHIELIYEPTQCSLRIKDDGQGFDVENQAMRNGFGLLGMAERAERIRAELKIQSDLEQGTEIVVSINRGLSQHESTQ